MKKMASIIRMLSVCLTFYMLDRCAVNEKLSPSPRSFDKILNHIHVAVTQLSPTDHYSTPLVKADYFKLHVMLHLSIHNKSKTALILDPKKISITLDALPQHCSPGHPFAQDRILFAWIALFILLIGVIICTRAKRRHTLVVNIFLITGTILLIITLYNANGWVKKREAAHQPGAEQAMVLTEPTIIMPQQQLDTILVIKKEHFEPSFIIKLVSESDYINKIHTFFITL